MFAGKKKKSKIWQFFKLVPGTYDCKCLIVDNVTENVCSSVVPKNSAWSHLQHFHASLYHDLNLSKSSGWKQDMTKQVGRCSEIVRRLTAVKMFLILVKYYELPYTWQRYKSAHYSCLVLFALTLAVKFCYFYTLFHGWKHLAWVKFVPLTWLQCINVTKIILFSVFWVRTSKKCDFFLSFLFEGGLWT